MVARCPQLTCVAKKTWGEQKSEGSNNYTSSSATIIMHKPNQWSLRLRGAATLLMNGSNEQWALCVCVYVREWLVLMSLMNRCGSRSLWTPAVAISPKEQTNHPAFQIWAGYSVSLKLKDPSLLGPHECSLIMPSMFLPDTGNTVEKPLLLTYSSPFSPADH